MKLARYHRFREKITLRHKGHLRQYRWQGSELWTPGFIPQSAPSLRKSKAYRENIAIGIKIESYLGTGKTTITRKFGQVYYDMGFLSSPDLIECSVFDLVGQYVGHTEKLFEKVLGKVLFVEVMNKMVIVFAGYEKEMNTPLAVNPCLARRLSEEIILDTMPPAKCLQVLGKEFRMMRIILSELADTSLSAYSEVESIVEQMSRLSNWGNVRDVKAIAQKFIHHAFGAVGNTPGTTPSLSADEAIVIMQDALNQQRQRLGVLRMAAVPPSSTLPIIQQFRSSGPFYIGILFRHEWISTA
ncbi:hypothetical protein BS47DRAFT_1483323 [Hydnum rufescens UP504]|uniref:Uncharacterized protein n=1 Tax=Hydnum rufescens UP504 TaxID=1448309 RepID=A0A9P6B4W6_9AGAM|nr:hypothetical protein BS47DRAFT_1483323 [Hydnum rufescens UP504]